MAFATIFHAIEYSSFLSFNFHRCLLSSVSFFRFSCVNDVLWFLHLALKSVAVSPIYVSVVLGGDYGLVNYFFCQAFSFQWAFVFVSTVAHYLGVV